jgi:hypothetical protein
VADLDACDGRFGTLPAGRRGGSRAEGVFGTGEEEPCHATVAGPDSPIVISDDGDVNFHGVRNAMVVGPDTRASNRVIHGDAVLLTTSSLI